VSDPERPADPRPDRSTTVGRLGAVAPVPFVGLAAILVALIVFTPVLLAPGPSPLAVQAYLGVYRAAGSSSTEFALHAYDDDVPYSSITLAIASGFSWSGSCPSGKLSWNVTNATDVTASILETADNPVVVNATAVYDQSGTRTVYAGELAVYVTNLNSSSESLVFAACPWTAALGTPGPWAVSHNAADPIPLVNYGTGGPP
jgi:hypothetical protein